MIVDSNTHISENGFWFNTKTVATIEDLLSSMSKANITKSLILPLPGVVLNESVQALEEKYPDQIIAGSFFNPNDYVNYNEAINAFIEKIVSKQKKIVKFHNRLCGYSFYDEIFLKVLEYNNSLSKPIPIAICGIFHDSSIYKAIVPPVYIFELAQKFSKTQFLILHGAGTWIFKTAEMTRSLKNVQIDLSFTISKYRGSSIDQDINWLCKNFDERIIWGSDSPEISQIKALEDLLSNVGKINSNKLDNILGNNILSLLGVDK